MPNKMLAFVGVLFSCSLCADTITAYHGYSTWATAAQQMPGVQPITTTEFAADGKPTATDVSLGDWAYTRLPVDWFFSGATASLYANPHHTPYLQFSTPVYAFGAQFSYLMADSGLGVALNTPLGLGWRSGLTFSLDPAGSAACTPLGGPSYCVVNEFFGFTSTTPISAVYFETTRGWGQGFTMQDVSFADDGPVAAPEPSTCGLVLVALMLFCGTFLIQKKPIPLPAQSRD